MKHKKFCLIFILIMFMTGCSVQYNVSIIDETITEVATFKLHNTEVLSNSPYYTLQQMSNKYYINSDFFVTQERKEYSDNNYQYVDFKNSYDITEYLNSYALDICYSAYNVIRENDNIKISTSNKFLCYDEISELSNVTVSVKTNHSVIEHNADKVVDDEYIWEITKENSSNKPINLILSEKYENESSDNSINEYLDIIIAFLIAILSIIGVGLIIALTVYIKSKKNK